ncbi:efflux RND transporter permease subunit, partial [Staphylococcus aureus]|uniref:efflux RND transporter permease subunit n=1 Tax=Staphylococcus aureus TaxID=1280 RepID=UPI00123E5502
HGTLNLMSFSGIIMLMGLVAKNAILLLDAARSREAVTKAELLADEAARELEKARAVTPSLDPAEFMKDWGTRALTLEERNR